MPPMPAGIGPQTPDDALAQALFGTPQGIPGAQLLQEGEKGAKMIERDPPDPSPARKALVKAWIAEVKHAEKHWEPAFKKMREDQDWAIGKQWSKNPKDRRYVANITLREVSQRVAFLYARNPKAIAKRREMILNTVWDGTEQSLQAIEQAGQMAIQSGSFPGAAPAPAPEKGPLPDGRATPSGGATGHGPAAAGRPALDAQSDDGRDDAAGDGDHPGRQPG